jgi:hypothetical protein
MVAEVFAGIGAFNSMFSIAKSPKDMNDVAVRNAAVSQLWEQIFTAQSRYSEAVEHIRELEAKLAKFETWESEKQRYTLKDVSGRGEFAYVIKSSEQRGEPTHAICARCYQQDKKSILQWSGKGMNGETHWRCDVCTTVVSVFGRLAAA